MIGSDIGRLRIVSFLLFIFLVTLVNDPSVVFSEMSCEVYIYSFTKSSSSEKLSSYFNNKSQCVVAYYDLNDGNYSVEFLKIIYVLTGLGIKVVPQGLCTSCLLDHYTLNEIYQMFAFPLVVFFRDGRLTAITIATTDYEVLDQALVNAEKDVKIFAVEKTYTLTNEDTRNQLEKIITRQKGTVANYVSIFQLLPIIIAAAAVDAINPCEFYVLIVFLSFVTFRFGKKAILKLGIAYSVAIFIIYFSMGLGLWQLIAYVQEARLFIVILGFVVGLRAVLNFIFGVFGLSLGLRDIIGTFLNRRFKRVPESFSKKLSTYLERVSDNPITAFVVGVVASAFLLPCTSGPYLIALSLIANLKTMLEGMFLLIIYNSVIITPFLAITVSIYMLKLKTSELKKWSSKQQKWLNLIAGILMILLSVYLISAIL
jgi:cytochrome c biogenesis protein CcdA